MPIHNSDVAEIFNKVADMLDMEGANQFRMRAYRNAARTIEDLPQSVAGSFRRPKQTVGDLDILAAVKRGSKIIDHGL